jgi:hypothetical protein
MTDDRRQGADDSGQKTDVRGQMAEDGVLNSEGGSRKENKKAS